MAIQQMMCMQAIMNGSDWIHACTFVVLLHRNTSCKLGIKWAINEIFKSPRYSKVEQMQGMCLLTQGAVFNGSGIICSFTALTFILF